MSIDAIVTRGRGWYRRSGGGSPSHTPLSLTMMALVGMLVVLGLLMVLSTSSLLGLEEGISAWDGFVRQSMWAVVGLVAFGIAAHVHFRAWRTLGPVILAVAFVTLVLVLVPGIGSLRDGARRWIEFGPVGFQPSEIAKLGMLCYAATVLDRRVDRLDDWRATFAPVFAVVVALGVLVMLEPDLDTTIEIALIAATVLFVGGVALRHIGFLLALGGAVTLGFVLAFPWRMSRLLAFLHPTADPQGAGYQTRQSLIHIGSGGLSGVGLGQGRAKWEGGLPAVHTDFIFSNIGEELGLLGGLIVLALFLMFAVVGFRIAVRIGEHDRFGMLLAAGATAWVGFQALINTAMTVGLLPVTGTPLPFISVGGSSLVSFMIAAGILVNLGRHCTPRTVPRSAGHPAVRARAAVTGPRPAPT